METGIIEAVSTKFANKYNSGAVKVNGTWMNVIAKVPISAFKSNTQVSFETEKNDKGYTSIVAVGEVAVAEKPKRTKSSKTTNEVGTRREIEDISPKVTSYEDNKNRRILVQGIVQACVQAPGLVSLSITNTDELAEATEQLALRLINFVDANV